MTDENPNRTARDYLGVPQPMPSPPLPYTRRAAYEGGIIELWARPGKAECFAIVYGLQIVQGLDYVAAAQKLGEAFLHSAQCDGVLD